MTAIGLLTTEALVADIKEDEKKDAGAAAGGMPVAACTKRC
jgi:hypothetical protein